MNRRTIYTLLSAGAAWPLAELSGSSTAAAINEHARLSPFLYRVLIQQTYRPVMEMAGPMLAAWLFWFLLLALFLLLLDEHLQAYYPASTAMTWSLLGLATFTPLVWRQPAGALWSALEAVTWLVALALLDKRRDGWLAPLVFVATLNRETAVFLVVLVWLVRRNWKQAALLGAVWAATYGAIRLHYGPAEPLITLREIALTNLSTQGLIWAFIGLVLFGWLAWLAWKGYPLAAGPLRRAAWVVPPFLLAVGVFGIWLEWRLVLTLWPVLIPLAAATGVERV